MTDTPINLNRVRKARAKVEKTQTAKENAIRFGRTLAEKKADRKAAKSPVDGHRLERE